MRGPYAAVLLPYRLYTVAADRAAGGSSPAAGLLKDLRARVKWRLTQAGQHFAVCPVCRGLAIEQADTGYLCLEGGHRVAPERALPGGRVRGQPGARRARRTPPTT